MMYSKITKIVKILIRKILMRRLGESNPDLPKTKVNKPELISALVKTGGDLGL